MEAFDFCQHFLNNLFFTPRFLHWALKSLTPWGYKLRASLRLLNAFAARILAEAREQSKTARLSLRTDLLALFTGAGDENGQPFSDEYLRDVIMNTVIAGRDTTVRSPIGLGDLGLGWDWGWVGR